MKNTARQIISDERVIIEGLQSIRGKLQSRWADGQDSDPPSAGSTSKKQKSRKRKHISWAQLLKRTFKIDVFKCYKCGERVNLIGVVFDQPTITTTLRALGLPVRAPPIAPARTRQLEGYGSSNDGAGADVDYGWPD